MNTTTTKEERTFTRCGVTAPETLWKSVGFEVVNWIGGSSELRPTSTGKDDGADADIYMARNATGCDDWRALAWLYQRRQDQAAERTKSTATARLADALIKAGDEFVHAARIMRQQAEIASR
jgi:hypothetical protein